MATTEEISNSSKKKIKLFAVYSRVGILILQFFSNIIIPDHNAGVFQKPLNTDFPKSYLDVIIEFALGGLTRWDGQYFLHIAEYGYTYENTIAFFPLFPLIIRKLSYLILYFINFILFNFLNISNFISFHSVLIITSVLFNNLLFIKCSVILYKLSLLVLKNEELAYISAILFCINPASIFFSACYSESLYCYLVFYSLLKIEEKNQLVNYIIVGLTAMVRSNGLINIGFFIYKYLKLQCIGKVPFFYNFVFNLGLILSVLPFFAFQLFCYAKFCLQKEVVVPDFIYTHGQQNNFVFPGSNSSWCHESIPFAYNYVQKHYWNVGFLNYYEIKQIPNFFLAAPMIYIIIQGSWSFVRHYKLLILYLGFVKGESGSELPIEAFPYVVHGFALTIFAIFMIHIQVATRLLASSSPVLYWFCSKVLALSLKDSLERNFSKKFFKENEHFCKGFSLRKSAWKSYLFTERFSGYSFFIKWYFFSYLLIGTFMFTNYLPWT